MKLIKVSYDHLGHIRGCSDVSISVIYSFFIPSLCPGISQKTLGLHLRFLRAIIKVSHVERHTQVLVIPLRMGTAMRAKAQMVLMIVNYTFFKATTINNRRIHIYYKSNSHHMGIFFKGSFIIFIEQVPF